MEAYAMISACLEAYALTRELLGNALPGVVLNGFSDAMTRTATLRFDHRRLPRRLAQDR